MKSVVNIVILALTILNANGQGLERRISFSCSEMILKKVLIEFGDRYDLKFSYGKDLIDIDKPITIDLENETLKNALEKVFAQADIEYIVSGDQIALRAKKASDATVLVRGKVLDRTTGKPLPFASVRLDKTALGTATNDEGEFILNIPWMYRDGNLIISFVGYKNHHLPAKEATTKAAIHLVEQPQQLNTVVVTAKTGISILQEAISRIKENYDTGEVIYTYFLRDLTLQDDEPIGASETLYQAYRGPSASNAKQIKAIKGRRVKDFSAVQTILQTFIRWTGFQIGVGTGIIFSSDLTAKNNGSEFPGPKFLEHHQFELLGTSLLDGKEVYVITFDQSDSYKGKSLYKGKFYIDTESLAFLRVESALSPKGIKHARFFGTPRALALLLGYARCSILGEKTIINYKSWNGKWYPSSAEILWNASLVKTNKNFAADLVLKGNMVVTNIQSKDTKPFNSSEMLSEKDLKNWEYHYKPAFWDGNNAIPADRDIENAFRTIAEKNREHGLDMDFWRRYQPYKSNPSLLVRDSILCQAPVIEDDSIFSVHTYPLNTIRANGLMEPRYPALNRTFRTEHFMLHYIGDDSTDAQQVASTLEDNYDRVLGDFRIDNFQDPIHVELYPNTEHYHFAIGNPDAPDSDVGMAVDNNLFKLVSPGNPGAYHTRESLLKAAVHEFAHCIHYHFIDRLSEKDQKEIGNNSEAPWLFEAIASYEAGQFYHPANFEYIRQEHQFTLNELNDVEENGKIYDVGFLLIEFIKVTWGKDEVLNMLHQNGNTEGALGISETEFESRFNQYIKSTFLSGGK